MANWIKLGIYAAAGVGTYEILRRYGLLQKAGDWLSQQVPDEYKDQARQYVSQARDRAGEYGNQIRDRAGQYGERAQQLANQATEAVRSYTGQGGEPATAGGGQNNGLSQQGGVDGPTANRSGGNGHTGGPQNLTGPGRGTSTATDEPSGTHVSHTVGRGVVR